MMPERLIRSALNVSTLHAATRSRLFVTDLDGLFHSLCTFQRDIDVSVAEDDTDLLERLAFCLGAEPQEGDTSSETAHADEN